MTLPKLITLGTLAALGAYGQDQASPPTLEQLKSLTGAKVAVRPKVRKAVQGRLTQVTAGQVVVESFDSKHSATQVPVSDIQSIEELHFRGSRTDLILRKPGSAAKKGLGAALYYPGALMLAAGAKLVLDEPPMKPTALRKTVHVVVAVPGVALAIPGAIMLSAGAGLLNRPGLFSGW